MFDSVTECRLDGAVVGTECPNDEVAVLVGVAGDQLDDVDLHSTDGAKVFVVCQAVLLVECEHFEHSLDDTPGTDGPDDLER